MKTGVIRVSMEAKKNAERMAFRLSIEEGRRVTVMDLVTELINEKCGDDENVRELGRMMREAHHSG